MGEDVNRLFPAGGLLLFKGLVMSAASGVFLYLGTLHDLAETPLIRDFPSKEGFFATTAGFALTALVRWIIGEAHHL